MNKLITATAISGVLFMTIGCNPTNFDGDQHAEQNATGDIERASKIWPALDIDIKPDAKVEVQIARLLEQMTLQQKVAQMIQPEIQNITVEDMRKYGFGSYLNGGGSFPGANKQATPQDWIQLAEDLYQASMDASADGIAIPTMWGTDAVHGHNNVVGATLFPHNIGLGAANNPDLIEKIAEATATEVMVTGIDWVFAPTVATVRDDRWGRTYEGYSESPEIVKAYSGAIVRGLQGGAEEDFLGPKRVISTVKHFIGDGGTLHGDDQGDNQDTEQVLFDLHAQGYVSGLSVGAQSVMASFNSFHGEKMHGSHYFLTTVLKQRMGFDGLVVGDWNGHGQVKGCDNTSCPQAINAGMDIVMVPNDWKALYFNTIEQVQSGDIAMSRIDDAVTRILRVKIRAGLFDKPSPAKRELSGKVELIGQTAHRELAQQAVRESLVLLKNKQGILPIDANSHVLLAGDGADNIGKQSGGWTVTWQGTNNTNKDFPGGTSIYDGFKQQLEAAGGKVTLSETGDFEDKPDLAVVVFGEDPYAEGEGDRATIEFQPGNKSSLAILKKLKAQNIPVVSVFISGRPMWVNPELNASDAFVAAWLPGSEGVGLAQVLVRNADGTVQHDFKGKLSFSWPNNVEQSVLNIGDEEYSPLFPYGFGLSYQDKDQLSDDLDADYDTTAVSEVVLFERNVKKPWALQLFESEQNHDIVSSKAAVGETRFKTIDRFVQEDAFELAIASKDGGIRLNSSEAQDYQQIARQNAKLEFDLRVLEGEGNKLKVAMMLSGKKREIALAPFIELGSGWQKVSVPLSCFTNQIDAFTDTTSPFALSSAFGVKVQLANIRIDLSQPIAVEGECD